MLDLGYYVGWQRAVRVAKQYSTGVLVEGEPPVGHGGCRHIAQDRICSRFLKPAAILELVVPASDKIAGCASSYLQRQHRRAGLDLVNDVTQQLSN